MEEQLVQLLASTQSSAEGPRKQAESQLEQLYASNDSFPLGLASIASHDSIPLDIRQAALLNLKNYTLATWSPSLDEFKGQVLLSDEAKSQLRHTLLDLSTSGTVERKIQSAASYVVSKIASADYPDDWPDLVPTLLQLLPEASDARLHGALKVLVDLVEDGFNEDQFFKIARDLVKALYVVAVNQARKSILRALAISVFRGCFDILEMVMEDHKVAVKGFAEETLNDWMPLLLELMKTKLPTPPTDDDQSKKEETEAYRGLVALKLQVVKVLMRIRSVFPAILSPQSPAFFAATWEELNILQPFYNTMYIENDEQGRLEDADRLPYTLDFLVLEALDFMQACLRAPPVRKELETQVQARQTANGMEQSNWVTDVMKLAVSYAQITTEEEGLWDVDVNIFLAEETSVTANYTPRTACGDLIIKLGEWLNAVATDGLLAYTKSLYSTDQSWRAKEAALYVLNQILGDWQDVNRTVDATTAQGFMDFVRHAMQQQDVFLRARGYLVAANLVRTSGEALHGSARDLLESCLRSMIDDPSEVVQVSCIRALQQYLQCLPPGFTLELQTSIITALSQWMASKDLSDMVDSDDLLITLAETLRDAVLLDTRICISGDGLNLLFTVASHGASNFQLSMLITETFEEICGTIAALGGNAYIQLCQKTLPSLTGAFDIGSITEENALTNLAAELLAVLAQHGSEPLPHGFVSAVMPKLNRLLLGSSEEELLKACTSALRYIVMHDYHQLFQWHDDAGKGGLEITLVIVDRLLNPSIDDNAASEVGGLAAELVEKAGSERLGPYLMQLLQAVAMRLSSASQTQFIQSLILVFARLSLTSAREVVDFLTQVQIGQESGLQVVMSKWLENSVNFAGYDEIRQNVIALSKLYSLHDPRLEQVMVKGNLIISQSDHIMTRSKARQNPDQYTMIPVPLKIIKVLVEELLSASGEGPNLQGAAEAALADEDGSDADDWEDEPNTFDLGLGVTKQELMSYAEGTPTSQRQRDDETQAYLTDFFRAASAEPTFPDIFNALSAEEQEKLRMIG